MSAFTAPTRPLPRRHERSRLIAPRLRANERVQIVCLATETIKLAHEGGRPTLFAGTGGNEFAGQAYAPTLASIGMRPFPAFTASESRCAEGRMLAKTGMPMRSIVSAMSSSIVHRCLSKRAHPRPDSPRRLEATMMSAGWFNLNDVEFAV